MNPRPPRLVEELFAKALEFEGERREAFLTEACAADEVLRRDVESLLAADRGAGAFMEEGALEAAARYRTTGTGGSWTGKIIGNYQVLDLLGAGGMGEVYKARDTRLNRFVAVKVLGGHITGDPVARQRFEREAQTIAALNHPNICVLYDVGQQDGVDFLVMEYLEGVTLEDRLTKGPIPCTEALKIALELADALDRAHQRGVVHRDLKPGNVMLTRDGAKLLDFGLAKLQSAVRDGLGASSAPTIGGNLTATGAIIGTLQYMAPEQIDGLEADARTDIFAFGAVLYEMLSGRKAFEGKSQSTLIAAIASAEPPALSESLPGLPPQLDHVLRRCLVKDPAERWHSVRDVLIELQWIANPRTPSPASKPIALSASKRRIAMTAAAAAVTVALAGGAVAFYYFRDRQSPAARAEVRFEIPVKGMPGPFNIALSPDGKRVAYVAAGDDRLNLLWVRPINSLEARNVSGTEGIRFADWSPDGRSVVFATAGELKRVDLEGQIVRTLALLTPTPTYQRGTWNQDGDIIFANRVLRRVPASGGEASDITQLDASLEETFHATPFFLPDGRHYLYQVGSRKPENRAIYLGELGSTDRRRLMPSESKALYANGFVLNVRDGTLMARPFDEDRLEFTGEAVPVVRGVATDGGLSAFYVSGEGTLIYRTANEMQFTRQWGWTDRKGTAVGPPGPLHNSPVVQLSPDGKKAALLQGAGVERNVVQDLWIEDFARNVRTRLTSGVSSVDWAIWSPDGGRLAFASRGGEGEFMKMFEIRSDGAVPAKLLFEESGFHAVPLSWSGQHLVFWKGRSKAGGGDLWVLPLSNGQKPFPYLATPADEVEAALSPDGRWIAYVSNESGSYQVAVRPFPNASSGKWQISTTGGNNVRWRHNGSELHFLQPDGQIVAVPVQADSRFEAGKPFSLFTTSRKVSDPYASAPFDAAEDGQRFLFSLPRAADTAQIAVILNWPAGIGH